MPRGKERIDLNTLLALLRRHRGAANATKSLNVALRFGIEEKDGRSIREAVNELIEQGYPIGSLTSPPYGYFWVLTREELEECVRNYESRAQENFRKAKRLREAFQASMDLQLSLL